jgi:hypothetical protein
MGERWVSPGTYSTTHSEDGRGVIVEAKARVVGADGRPVAGEPLWIPADPGVVTVSPTSGRHVRIAVSRPGATEVTLVHGDVKKVLRIEARGAEHARRVDIASR